MGTIKKTNTRLTYLKLLKNEAQSFQTNFKKRIHNFPWNKINNIPKNKIFSSTVIDVRGSKFTMISLTKEITKIKKKLEEKVKPNAFNPYIRSYLKDSARVKEEDVKSIYTTYSNELKKEFKFCYDDLSFCAEALNQINKAIRSQYKDIKESVCDDNLNELNINESEEIFMNDMFLESLDDEEKREYGDLLLEALVSSMEEDEMYDAKLAIYESCKLGEISVAERNKLLYEIDQLEMESSDDDYDVEDEITIHSPYEKFESVKSILYQQCYDGEITLEEREELISKAYQMIVESDETSNNDNSMKTVEDNATKEMDKEAKDLQKDVEKNNKQQQNTDTK